MPYGRVDQPMISSRNELGESIIFHVRGRISGRREAVKKGALPWQCKDHPSSPSQLDGFDILQAPSETSKQVAVWSEILMIAYLTGVTQPDGKLAGDAWWNRILTPTVFSWKSGKATI